MAEMVELKNIQKSFGSNHILKGVNMSIGKGEVVVILGPSGSGKTTLLRTINFLDAADEGNISVSGFEVDAKKHSKSQVIELRRKTAMVFQNYNLFANKTILENVMEGLVTVKKFKKSDAEAMSREILKKVGLEERCDFYPAQLSGGQQQRAGIARALILDPDVILFDEPTSALDPELVGEVLNTIKAVAQTGITMIVVTHEIAFAREVASRVVFMEGGVVVEEGKPEEILVAPKHPSTQRFLKRITNPNAE
jgi:L-cystine transport system ATP-binding protein